MLIAAILGMIFEKKIGVSGRDRLYWRSCAGSSGVLTEKQAYKAIDSRRYFYLWRRRTALAKALEMTGGEASGCGLYDKRRGAKLLTTFIFADRPVFALSLVMIRALAAIPQRRPLLVPVSLSIACGMRTRPRVRF
ncbi:hypothetical protein KCP74_08420 [Salmonella enterica subsp. enterica]|nr:hypothetical protein KCP74_08420 [Salmonella enterica subsp. enterica]